jgi:3-deoxy-D-manno-octulosonic-acid transferase
MDPSYLQAKFQSILLLLMRLLYNLLVRSYHLSILAASLFNPKARLWVAGRKKIFDRVAEVKKNSAKTIWFHCASLGEFEQGRPIIEKLKTQLPECTIVLTFFSPSGYEVRKNYEGADHIFYLPTDTPHNAQKFVELIRPDAAVFVKYEFWYNYLRTLKEKNIPLYLASGIFRKDHIFFRWNGGWFRDQLSNFTRFFVQDADSEKLLHTIGLTNVEVCGDTRFDRVCAIASEKKGIPAAETFKNGKKIFICGSTWEKDEKIMGDGKWMLETGRNWKMIIAPHEINEDHLSAIEKRFSEWNCIRYSKANDTNVKEAGVLIIDNIGMLASLYQYGDIAYVGGGFGDGIHSILEAAAYGMPVIFGPNHQKFIEAKELIGNGGGFCVTGEEDLKETFSLLTKDGLVLRMASMASRNYVLSKKGATEKISRVLLQQLTS